MDRQIICFNVPSFEIALARLHDPALRRWPTAVAPVHYRRSFLWEVSTEARQEGLYPGMALSYARQICPQLRVVSPDLRRVSLGESLVKQSFKRFSPVYEVAAHGEFYGDLTGSARLFGEPETVAARINNEISKRYGICGAVGVANNKLVSGVIANLLEPASTYRLRSGEERCFLAPLTVTSLPGLNRLFGPNTNETIANLEELRLKLLGDVAAVSVDQLRLVIGGKARLLKQWAVGIDPTPIWSDGDRPSLEIYHSFQSDEIDDDLLLSSLYRQLEKLCNILRRASRRLRSITLILHYSDGQQIIKRKKFLPASCLEYEIYPRLQELFLSVNRRVRVRRIGLNADPAAATAEQLDLFRQDRCDRVKNLTFVIDSIRERYGDESIRSGKVLNGH
jgi:DNA polymerase-4